MCLRNNPLLHTKISLLIEDKPNYDLPKQGRTYSTAEALTEETFEDKQPSQLLIHPTEYPVVKALLGTVFDLSEFFLRNFIKLQKKAL